MCKLATSSAVKHSSWKTIAALIVSGILLILLIPACVMVGLMFNKTVLITKENEAFRDVCVTKSCVAAATSILENMDPTANPCEDFFQFACGNYIKNTRIPDELTGVDTLQRLEEELWQDLAGIFEQSNSTTEIDSTFSAKLLYKSCANEDVIEENGEDWLKTMLIEEFGGWPILSAGYINRQDAIEKVISLRKRGVQPLISISVMASPKNPRKSALTIQQPDWFFSKSYYNNSNVMREYKQYLTKVVEYLGAPPNNSLYLEEIDLMIKLETEFAQALLSEVEKRDMTYREVSIPELEAELPQFEWRKLVDGLFSEFPSIHFDDFEKLVVMDWDYLNRAAEFLSKASKSQPKILENMMIWSYIQKTVSFLPNKYTTAQLEFNKVYTGQRALLPRARTCSFYVVDTMPFAAGRLYVSKYFSKSAKTQVEELIENMRAEFKEILQEVDWMDDSSKLKALEKIMFMSFKADYIYPKVGYPDLTYNDNHLDDLYSQYIFDEENFIENQIIIAKADAQKEFEKIRKPRDLTEWPKYLSPAVINAFYDPELNSIGFPAGILQSPFYNHKVPNYLNYGGIGYVIGHEIIHGFDDQGRKYDKNGVLVSDEEGSLWSRQIIDSYKARAKCFVKEYSSYVVKQVNESVNGELTLGENIADNGGIKTSLRFVQDKKFDSLVKSKAYKKWAAMNEEEQLLPGLPYTQEQLFFINVGQVWCGKARDAKILNRLKTDPHSPEEFRVNGPLSNLEAFATAFQCPWNQTNKCAIW